MFSINVCLQNNKNVIKDASCVVNLEFRATTWYLIPESQRHDILVWRPAFCLHLYCNSDLFIYGSAQKSKHKPLFKFTWNLPFLWEVSQFNSIHFAMFCHILQHYCNFCSDISNFCNVIATFAVIFITFCNFLTLQFLAKFFKFANFKKLHCIFNAKFYHAIYCMIWISLVFIITEFYLIKVLLLKVQWSS